MIDTRRWPTIAIFIYIYIRAFNGGKIGFGLSHDEGRVEPLLVVVRNYGSIAATHSSFRFLT